MVWLIGAGGLIIVALIAVGLADLIKMRDSISTSQFVLWAVLIVLLPAAGLIGYLFWRISRAESVQDAMSYHDGNIEGGQSEPPVRY
jgi:hypothetical protein